MTSPSGTTYYLNDPASGTMSEKQVSGSTTTWHDYLQGDGHIIAERSCTGAAPCSSGATWQYFVLDHLGSVAVATNGSGAVTERDSYDAWGRRRNSDGTDNASCSITSGTTRGFTGHEEMDSICEVNANARIYDPTIGRFMSADSIIPDPAASQSYNRYSYTENGPLSATDPTGHTDGDDGGLDSGGDGGDAGIETAVVTGYRSGPDPIQLARDSLDFNAWQAGNALNGIPSIIGYGPTAQVEGKPRASLRRPPLPRRQPRPAGRGIRNTISPRAISSA